MDLMFDRFDTRALWSGAGITAGIALVLGLVGHALPTSSGAMPFLTVAILAGMVASGFVAGRPRPEVALSAGGVAALIGMAALQVVNVVVALARGTLSAGDLVLVVFFLLLATSLGTIGGYLAFRRDLKDRQPEEADHSIEA